MKLSQVFNENLQKAKYQNIINSPNFQQWFGNSKVVDKTGNPLIVYHGTTWDFDRFKYGDFGFHFGTKQSAEDRIITKNLKEGESKNIHLGKLPYKELNNSESIWNYAKTLPEKPDEIRWFIYNAHHKLQYTIKDEQELKTFWQNCVRDFGTPAATHFFKFKRPIPNKQIIPFFLSIQNPLTFKDMGSWNQREVRYEIRQLLNISDDIPIIPIPFLLKNGYDGIKYINRYEDKGSISWIAFKPNQIKSFYNNGNFNKKSHNFNT